MARRALGLSKQKGSPSLCDPTSIKNLPDSNEKFHYQLVFQLIERRESLGITQRQLGERIGVTDYLLSKWEGGHRRPTGFLLWCWAESLGVKLVIEETNG